MAIGTATKVRKTKDGEGTIYKLEPALTVENGTVEYIIHSYIPSRDLYDGFIVLPQATILVACVPTDKGFGRRFGLFARDFQLRKLSAEKALHLIGYTVA